ncbi:MULTISPECIES: hypothetical protein [Halobacterium]|nr:MULTISPECIES: hypothetical protein [Halobacterium]MBB6088802.1 hypothetical protein [Halobacterium salinarum]MCF2165311.1 hypothetical protein [Halobacterium salinarum]MCF2167880.1 hypothetical protein [Halobacterium salinarum]MCF2238570.1 hypothetical protein [Halobacterium salinarum]MDL0118601.1 hypothetical protein [Halobacterium salinarum]
MRVRDWDDIVEDVVGSSGDPDDWRAVAGDRASGVGEDLYLGHPAAGVFHLKTYAKNPYEVRGVGTQIARKVDDGLADFLPTGDDADGRFAVQQPVADEDDAETKASELEQVVQAHADAPTTPDAFFDDVMDALDSPAFGPMEYDPYDRPDPVEGLAEEFPDADELLDSELDDLVDADRVGRGFQ